MIHKKYLKIGGRPHKNSQHFFLILGSTFIVLCFIFHTFSRYLVSSRYILRPDLSVSASSTEKSLSSVRMFGEYNSTCFRNNVQAIEHFLQITPT
jgi:hypothetical protein